jgi:hypothetical protein
MAFTGCGHRYIAHHVRASENYNTQLQNGLKEHSEHVKWFAQITTA